LRKNALCLNQSAFSNSALYKCKEDINVKKILAVINATYAVAKRKPEKIRLAGIRTLTSAIPVQRALLCPLCYKRH